MVKQMRYRGLRKESIPKGETMTRRRRILWLMEMVIVDEFTNVNFRLSVHLCNLIRLHNFELLMQK